MISQVEWEDQRRVAVEGVVPLSEPLLTGTVNPRLSTRCLRLELKAFFILED